MYFTKTPQNKENYKQTVYHINDKITKCSIYILHKIIAFNLNKIMVSYKLCENFSKRLKWWFACLNTENFKILHCSDDERFESLL